MGFDPCPPRYTEDFGALLSGRLRLNSSPQFLHHVLLPPLPAYDPPDGQFGVGRDPGNPSGPPSKTPVSPPRLPALPQDLPIAAARLHLGGLVSDPPPPNLTDKPVPLWRGPGGLPSTFPPCFPQCPVGGGGKGISRCTPNLDTAPKLILPPTCHAKPAPPNLNPKYAPPSPPAAPPPLSRSVSPWNRRCCSRGT